MANPEITNNDPRKLEVFNPVYEEAILLFAGSDTLVQGTIMAQKVAAAGAVTANVGNTGDGTVTGLALAAAPTSPPLVGDWNLEVTGTGVDGRNAGTTTPDGGNTGDGLVTALAIASGEFPEIGSWVLTCFDANEGGTATSTAVTITGTGDGTPGSVTPAANVKEGLYTLTCVEAITNKGRFEVADPDGERLEDLNITVAYSNTHFALTVQDGSNDYIVGDTLTFTITIAHGGLFRLVDPNGVTIKDDIVLPGGAGGTVDVDAGGITFTLADDTTDFAVADFFTMTVVAAEGGVFKLEDPNDNLVATGLTLTGVALTAKTFILAGMTFIITDGATDFIVGDKFALTITDSEHKWQPFDVDAVNGLQFPRGVLPVEHVQVGAGSPQRRMLIEGEVYKDKLIIDAGDTVTAAHIALLRAEGIIARINVENRENDNQ